MNRVPFHIGIITSGIKATLSSALVTALTYSVAAQNTPSPSPEAQCLETDNIESYKIETDDLIRFTMTNGDKMIMRLKSYCPQLRFHGYFSYTPMNGRLCAGADEIKTRSGLPCIIGSLIPESEAKASHAANQ
ncbi:MAG: hypothetical protein AB3N28_03315 [Kordiimonas sp.]